jgi:hypothetical protein
MDKRKAMGLFKLRINGLLEPFRLYGLDVLIPKTAEEIYKEALVLHARLSQQQEGEENADTH